MGFAHPNDGRDARVELQHLFYYTAGLLGNIKVKSLLVHQKVY